MPTPHPFLPYHYPVAALLVDDDTSLLQSLAAGLSRGRQVFTAPSVGAALARYHASHPVRRSFIRRSPDQTGLDQHRLVVDTPSITSLIDDCAHRQEIGLLIVDFHMPGGNGLELCESLRDEPCRRILLTGAADERVAVQAFNAGLIHQFVRKGHDVLEQLGDVLQREQLCYLRDASASLSEGLSDRLGAFEHEPAVCEALQALMAQLGVSEYYLSTEPNGLVVIDRSGRRQRILVQSDEERRSVLEILGVAGDDRELAATLVYVEPCGDPQTLAEHGARVVSSQLQVPAGARTYLLAVEAC